VFTVAKVVAMVVHDAIHADPIAHLWTERGTKDKVQ
jgi:hypothetical protein